jgi:hypothetical protein
MGFDTDDISGLADTKEQLVGKLTLCGWLIRHTPSEMTHLSK